MTPPSDRGLLKLTIAAALVVSATLAWVAAHLGTAAPVSPASSPLPDVRPASSASGSPLSRRDVLAGFLDPGRDAAQQPERVLDTLGIRKGMAVADIGCGSGYFSFRLADRVGPRGLVWAVDVDPEAVAIMRERLAAFPAPNVRVVRSRFDNCLLAPGSIDLAFLCDVHFILPVPLLPGANQERQLCVASLRRALRPGGRMVVVEGRTNPEYGGRIDPKKVARHLEAQGFRLVASHDFLANQMFLVLEVRR